MALHFSILSPLTSAGMCIVHCVHTDQGVEGNRLAHTMQHKCMLGKLSSAVTMVWPLAGRQSKLPGLSGYLRPPHLRGSEMVYCRCNGALCRLNHIAFGDNCIVQSPPKSAGLLLSRPPAVQRARGHPLIRGGNEVLPQNPPIHN